MKRPAAIAAPVMALSAALLAAPRPARAYEAGHVFITNRGGNNIVELTSDLVFVRARFADAGLSGPNGMAFDPTDNLYVADTRNDRVVVFDAAGAMLRQWSTLAELGSALESLNFDAGGRLWTTANPGLGSVVRWRADGTMPVRVVDARPEFVNLANVNFTPAGNVLVSDFSSTRGVRELDPTTGAVVREFGMGTSRHEDMIVDGDGNIFVSGYDRSEVFRFDPTGALVTSFTAPGLMRPTGIVLTSDCRLVVASFGTNELFEFRHDGTFLRRVAVEGVSQPESLAIAGLSVAGAFELRDPVPVCRPPGADAGAGDAGAGDAGAGADAMVAADGGPAGDASADAPDAGADAARADAGATPDPAGCGCRAVGGPAGSARAAALTAALFALLAAARARRGARRFNR